jgi:hypothetical protein
VFTHTRSVYPLSRELSSEHRPKLFPLLAYGFVAHLDPTFVQEVFNIAQRQRQPDIEPQRKTNDPQLVLK